MAATFLVLACGQQTGARQPGRFQIYQIGAPGQQQITIAIDPINKGLGTELPWRLGVAFTPQELKRFFSPDDVPGPARLVELLEQEKITMARLDGCNAYVGDSPISVIFSPSRNHGVKWFIEQQKENAEYEFAAKPKTLYGLLNYGGVRYKGTEKYLILDELRLPTGDDFGFRMVCGHLEDDKLEGGCVVERDLHKNLSIKYGFCEKLLPYWKEIDSLYLEISKKIVRNPKIQRSYWIGVN